MQKQTKKHLLIAFALAGEWILAFAFAKHFANALADANWSSASPDDELWRLRVRIRALERAHGVESDQPWPARLKHTLAESEMPF